MFTCGLVRSNLALATGSSSGRSCRGSGHWFATGLLRGSLHLSREVRWICMKLWKGCRGPPRCSGPRHPELVGLLLDDLVGHVARNLGVAVELHGVDGAARRLRAQVADVAEHLGERDERAHDLDAGGVLHRLDLPATRVQVA